MNPRIQEAFINELQKIAGKTPFAFGLKPPSGIKAPPATPGASRTPIAASVARKYAPRTQTVRPSTLPGGMMKVRKSPLFARR